MVRLIYLYLLAGVLVGTWYPLQGWALTAKEEELAQDLEEEYSAYLEAQLSYWNAQRFGQGEQMLDRERGKTPDLAQAYRVWAVQAEHLDNTLTEVKAADSAWLLHLSRNIEQARAGKVIATDMSFAEQSFQFSSLHNPPTVAKKLSSLRWQALQEMYGAQVQERLLTQSLAQNNSAATETSADTQFVWIQDPWKDMTASLDLRKLPNFAAHNSSLAPQIAALEKQGIVVDKLSISNFADTESQANELMHLLNTKYFRDDKRSVMLLSSGQASAVVYKLLDLHPELRQNPQIFGWVNWNGRLYGMPLREAQHEKIMTAAKQKDQRALAHVATPWGITPTSKIYAQLTQDQLARNERTLSLGMGFPILSVVPSNAAERNTIDLSEATVMDGRLMFLKDQNLEQAIQQLRNYD